MFGLFGKKFPEVTPTEVQARMAGPQPPLLVDVREPGEYEAGHIPGSLLMPLGTLGSRLEELPKDREMVVICRSGNRSGMATQHLCQAGYQAVNMAGGMLVWNGPVER